LLADLLILGLIASSTEDGEYWLLTGKGKGLYSHIRLQSLRAGLVVEEEHSEVSVQSAFGPTTPSALGPSGPGALTPAIPEKPHSQVSAGGRKKEPKSEEL
jgi:hypothetical protein